MSLRYVIRCDGCEAPAGETRDDDPWILPAGWKMFTVQFYGGGSYSGKERTINVCSECWPTKPCSVVLKR